MKNDGPSSPQDKATKVEAQVEDATETTRILHKRGVSVEEDMTVEPSPSKVSVTLIQHTWVGSAVLTCTLSWNNQAMAIIWIELDL